MCFFFSGSFFAVCVCFFLCVFLCFFFVLCEGGIDTRHYLLPSARALFLFSFLCLSVFVLCWPAGRDGSTRIYRSGVPSATPS